jgi:TRAP-type uncharacterized transport system substrate-binding protein
MFLSGIMYPTLVTKPPHPPATGRLSRFQTIALALVILLPVVLVALLWRSMPPRNVTMATDAAGGAYHDLAGRYRAILARDGVRLNLVETDGSLDSLARLRDPRSGVSVALLQAGITSERESPGMVSLGTLGYEPVWVFYRGFELGTAMGWAKGKRVAVGPEGSGTRKLALDLFGALGIDVREVRLSDLTADAAADALQRGELDIVVMVASWELPVVRRLLTAESIKTASFPRADAHVALRPYLTKLILPRGVADLARDRPPTDLVLVAPKTSLVVRADLHPAIQYLLLRAAAEVHAAPGLFKNAGQFPAAEPIDLPLSDAAQSYYKTGSPVLQRYLPFWVAALASQLLIVLIPLVGLAYPLLRVAPGLYSWGMRRRIYQLYGELKFIDAQLDARDARAPVDDLRLEIDRLERHVNHMRTPLAFAQMLYTLRHHISLVRARLDKRQS